MKVLILTQKVDVNDAVLGFFHRWLIEFSKHCDHIIVICLEKGSYDLPNNIEVLSLGKEKGVSRFGYIRNFFTYVWGRRKEYNTVFVHMNPIYVVLAGWLWKLLGKRIVMWYTHRQVDLKLRIAEKFAYVIFSASKYSFRLETKKLQIIGHGIDLDKFTCTNEKQKSIFRIVSVGRITKIKNCDTLLRAGLLVKNALDNPVEIVFVGAPVTDEDKEYFKELKKLVAELKLEENVIFVGSVSNNKVLPYYCNASVSTNMTPTGGIDKSVLESMASQTPAIVSNEAFREYFAQYADDLIFIFKDYKDLAQKLIRIHDRGDIGKIRLFLKQQTDDNFSVANVVARIASEF